MMDAQQQHTDSRHRKLYMLEQMGQLAKHTPNAIISSILVMGLVLYVSRNIIPTASLLGWVAAVVTVNMLFLLWHLGHKKSGLSQLNMYRYLYAYQLLTLGHGLLWGALPFLLLAYKSAELQLLVYYVICGMAAGAVATQGMIYRLYLTFMLPLLLPVIAYQLLVNNNMLFDTGSLGLLVIFFIAMLMLSHAHYMSVLRGIRLLFANEELLDDLRSAYDSAESASRAKSEFLSNMSHELRTPLNAIMGFSSLLIKFSNSKQPEKLREFAGNINEAGRHLSALMSQVLDMTRIETGEVKLELAPLPLQNIINECTQLLVPLAHEHNVVIDCQCDNIQGKYVEADALRLRQVLINLLSNAIKYNNSGGRVVIRCVEQKDGIMVEVADTGLGIDKVDFASILSPFSRAHHHANIEGSGIGLAITKKNLELMGSDINFYSNKGEGSRFWFVLPQVEPVEKPLTLPKVKKIQPVVDAGRSIKLLYVEDNPLGMRLMQELMKGQENIAMYAAMTGEEGYQLALQVRPDIILLDINLPDIDGLEVLRRLRSSTAFQAIPVVALSASALPEEIDKGLQAGFDKYLQKPCDSGVILNLIYELTA